MQIAPARASSEKHDDDIEEGDARSSVPLLPLGSSSRGPAPEPQGADTYTLGHAYAWLFRSLHRDGVVAMGGATALIAAEAFCANQPAVLLGQIVDIVGATMAQAATEGTAVAAEGAVNATGEVTAGSSPELSSAAWPLFGIIGASLVGKEVATIGRKYIVEKTATKLQKDAFLEQATHLLAVRVDALQDRRVGDLAVRLDKSVEGLCKLQKLTFMEGIPNVATAGFALALTYNEHWTVGLVMCGVLLAGSAVTTLQVRSQKGIRISLNEQKAAMGGSIAELLGNLGYIRASGMRQTEERRLEDQAEGLRHTEFQHHKYMMTFHGLKDLIEGLGFALVLGTAINLALTAEISSGGILTLAMLYSKASQPLAKMHGVFDGSHEAVIKIGALSAVRSLPKDPGLAGTLSPSTSCNASPVVAEALSVALGRGHDSTQVIDSLCLHIAPGEVVGLAGGSGSGKSTLLRAILGLVPDYGGSLNILGAEARNVDKAELARAVAYAQQEPFVMTGTLRDNLLIAQPGVGYDSRMSDREMEVALQKACLGPQDTDIAWNEGLDTHIHEGGRNLSGGQRQRLALARIFLHKEAELIVLDEATSALDNTTEARVMQALHAHAAEAGRGIIMVAHRLSTMRAVDRVLVMDDGCIVQEGTYQQLSVDRGAFNDLLTQAGQVAPSPESKI